MPQIQEVIVLFDEFGTPSFKDTTSSGNFLGVSALYTANNEVKIFRSLGTSMGLSNSQPVKNNRITKNRANKIASQVSLNNLYITARYLDLNNEQLEETSINYLNVSNLGRKIFRGVKERKDVHLLHSQILLSCVFDNIVRFLDCNDGDNYRFYIFIDSFSYPKSDSYIVLDYCSENLQKHVQKFQDESINNKNVFIEPLEFFTKSMVKRERLIDCLNSIISRSILDSKSDKYDLEPRNIIQQGLDKRFSFQDITNDTIIFLHESLYDDIQSTKIEDKSLIIV
ncbi:MAG: hypothetical protein DHS20C13_01130 [Thermodesulfobacteriota bacterium]|nr:MAG: hypothetical protein DHS20C13_01130 [Thermodesulfobacteriota bacterium]